MHNNEFAIDECHEVDDHKEHHGSTKFKEFDGTERGDDKQVPTLDEFNDTADSDRYDNECTQHEVVFDAILDVLTACKAEHDEKLAVRLIVQHYADLGYYPHIINEAANEAEKTFSNLKNTPN